MSTPYHLRRQDKALDDEGELLALLRRGRFMILGLSRGDEPYVVTMNYGLDVAKLALYFHAADEGLKLEFLEANPRVCGTVIEDLGYKAGECDHAFRSVVVRGAMRVVADMEEKKHGLGVMIDQLEPDPAPVRRRTLGGEERLRKVTVLRLDIGSLTGKQAL